MKTTLQIMQDARKVAPGLACADTETKNKALYAMADALEQEGRLYEAAVIFYALGDYADAWERCLALWKGCGGGGAGLLGGL